MAGAMPPGCVFFMRFPAVSVPASGGSVDAGSEGRVFLMEIGSGSSFHLVLGVRDGFANEHS